MTRGIFASRPTLLAGGCSCKVHKRNPELLNVNGDGSAPVEVPSRQAIPAERGFDVCEKAGPRLKRGSRILGFHAVR